MSAQIALLAGNRLHLQHGPIDLVITADGETEEIARGFMQAAAVFPNILPELVAELGTLRTPLGTFASPLTLSPSHEGRGNAVADTTPKAPLPSWERGWGEGGSAQAYDRPAVIGPIARRMVEAAWPYREVFITPMVAVAGAVAEHVLAAMVEVADLRRVIVNNGGDIALHLAPGEALRAGVVGDLALPRIDATIEIDSGNPVRGIATSGWRGRSQSLGIADSVTVLARSAAEADAAATMIANAVNVEDRGIIRKPARELRDDSDLGELPVTVSVGALPPEKVERALEDGLERAEELLRRGLIVAAYLQLQGQSRVAGEMKRITAGKAA